MQCIKYNVIDDLPILPCNVLLKEGIYIEKRTNLTNPNKYKLCDIVCNTCNLHHHDYTNHTYHTLCDKCNKYHFMNNYVFCNKCGLFVECKKKHKHCSRCSKLCKSKQEICDACDACKEYLKLDF